MRTLIRNKMPFWYAAYTGKVPIYDEDGNETGEYRTTHSEPVMAYGNVAPAVGIGYGTLYGTGVSYDHRIIPDDPELEIDENALIWVRKPITGPHEYRVTRVARSLNYLALTIKKVEVSE